MTTNEIRDRFNLQYNSLNGNQLAPGFDDYELSLYLTKAHKEIIDECYSGTKANNYLDGFQSNEMNRHTLNRYIGHFETKILYDSGRTLGGFIVGIVQLSEDVLYIINEHVRFNGKDILVKPTTYDEILIVTENPYRRPSLDRALKLEDYDYQNKESLQILVHDKNITDYHCYYIKNPEPIILSDLSLIPAAFAIEGKNTENIPIQLTENYHLLDMVINRAVELATRDYKQNGLETQVQLNNRN